MIQSTWNLKSFFNIVPMDFNKNLIQICTWNPNHCDKIYQSVPDSIKEFKIDWKDRRYVHFTWKRLKMVKKDQKSNWFGHFWLSLTIFDCLIDIFNQKTDQKPPKMDENLTDFTWNRTNLIRFWHCAWFEVHI